MVDQDNLFDFSEFSSEGTKLMKSFKIKQIISLFKIDFLPYVY